MEIVAWALPVIALAAYVFWPDTWPFLIVTTLVASLMLALNVVRGFVDRFLPADFFSLLAIGTCGLHGQWTAAAVIASCAILGTLIERHASRYVQQEALLQPLATEEVSKLSVGDVLVVNQGERAPVDGLVVKGTAHVEQSLLTGEAKSIEKLVGDPVMATSLVKAGRIKIRVTRPLQSSAAERMHDLWENAGRHPAQAERLAERLSGLVMIALGLCGSAAWAYLKDPALAATCFALAGAANLTVAMRNLVRSRLNQAMKRGLVLKGGRFFEPLAELKALVIEKTGLLTYQDLHVGRLDHDPSISDAFVWECVAVAEKFSDHPAGRALFRTAAKQVGAMADPDEFQTYPNRGVRAGLAGHEVMIGTAELLRSRAISFESDWLAGSTSPIEGTGTDVFIALDGACIARVRIQNRPRMEIGESLKRLRETGVATQVLLTGDTVQVAGAFAKGIGLTDFRPTSKPEDVSHEVGRLAQQGPVALLGDGTRHAQALIRSDIGMVMGNGGQGLHVESAGLVLLTDDLSHLPELLSLARQTRRLWKLLFLAWSVSLVAGLVIAFIGWLPPLVAALYAFVMLRIPLNEAFRFERLATVGQRGRLARK